MQSKIFTPNWKLMGLSSSQEGMMHVIKHLFKNKEHIVKLGFNSEVPIYVGEHQFILKGKNPGRKKDKEVK